MVTDATFIKLAKALILVDTFAFVSTLLTMWYCTIMNVYDSIVIVYAMSFTWLVLWICGCFKDTNDNSEIVSFSAIMITSTVLAFINFSVH
jgi:hypothetical protein